jgi:hypothetical protein
MMYSILGVLRIFKLDETETSHDSAIDNTAIAIEKLRHVIRTGIRGQSSKI